MMKKEHYDAIVQCIDALMNAKPDTPEHLLLQILATQADHYENVKWPLTNHAIKNYLYKNRQRRKDKL